MKLSIFFNGQFWEGVVEFCDGNIFKVGRYIFGGEPQDAEILEFVVKNEILRTLDRSSGVKAVNAPVEKRINPKRLARQVNQELAERGASTMAQEAMRQELELRKQVGKVRSKAEKEAEEAEKRLRSRQKAKDRHRGKA